MVFYGTLTFSLVHQRILLLKLAFYRIYRIEEARQYDFVRVRYFVRDSGAEIQMTVFMKEGYLFNRFQFLRSCNYPFPKQQILDSSKLIEFADDNFEFDENGGNFSKRVENAVGKGEIARYEQFLLFAQCFQKTCPADS